MTFGTTCLQNGSDSYHVSMVMILINSKLWLEPVQFFMTTYMYVFKYTLNGMFFCFFLFFCFCFFFLSFFLSFFLYLFLSFLSH